MTNGVLHGNLRAVGSRVEIECPKYLREISDEKFSICQANGSWTVYPKCSGKAQIILKYFNDLEIVDINDATW